MTSLTIGLDVGSTTVKAVVVDTEDRIVWQDYQRHGTKQPETVLDFMQRIEQDLNAPPGRFRIFITGSGGAGLCMFLGAKFVQEVNAVSLAVEKFHPQAGSVIELGGQDAKIIIFQDDPEIGRKKKIPSMNDKCAGGTGAVIDKINAKLRIPPAQLSTMGYVGVKLHPVAGKCGVFAETDINSLQKMGVPADELMASLFEAIVGQNLSVLTRGNTLRPEVLLLGGPNTYIRGMIEAWKRNIPKLWEERGTPLPVGRPPADLIKVPEHALYFAALGAVEFGRSEEPDIGRYRGTADLEHYLTVGRQEEKKRSGTHGLSQNPEELQRFLERYQRSAFVPATFSPGEQVEGFVGIDGGSTSTKAVLLDQQGEVLVKAYQLSQGNPIEDTIDMFRCLRSQVEGEGASLKVLGVGTTGYAKDILKDTLGADVALVETVAHTKSALHFYKEVDIICDVGGQDIKLMVLKNRRVKDFKLNTQCSAGNGYFLQSTAEGFGFPVEHYAEIAFSAQSMPTFGYGCAVFMQSDIVDFQRQGWRPEEIMAGLAAVLPKNIWLYVAKIPNLAALGRHIILQGGTQHNLAAVKAQVDFITSRFKGKAMPPEIIVHQHCGESGAIGAALEAQRLWTLGRETSFIGVDAVEHISYVTHRSEHTRCHFCKNTCLRTFVDVKIACQETEPAALSSPLPLPPGTRRLIVGNSCEKGLVEDVKAMRGIQQGLDAVKSDNPNLAEVAAKAAWKSTNPPNVADAIPGFALTRSAKQRVKRMQQRQELRIGMPRVLNMYSEAPLFSAYFESLGVPTRNLVYSSFTTEELYKQGVKRGSIDPCFPSKVAISHIHNLLYVHHKRKPLHLVFFPMIDCLTSDLHNTLGNRACSTVTATPEVVKAAFTKEEDLFARMGVRFLDTFVNVSEPKLFERQMFGQFKDILGLSREENRRAVEVGYRALDYFRNVTLRGTAREVLNKLEASDRLGIVVLGRSYHNDPGINHGILEELQKRGYPILTQDALPSDPDLLERLFGDEMRAGIIAHPMDISDVWKNAYSENTNRKVWAAKYVARHPNLVALELSSFKCGHDAPIYSIVEEIVEQSGTPYFCFKDIDENKPAGSIKIRLETIAYFLTRHREALVRQQEVKGGVQTAAVESQLRPGQRAARPVESMAVGVYADVTSDARANGCGTCGAGCGTADTRCRR